MQKQYRAENSGPMFSFLSDTHIHVYPSFKLKTDQRRLFVFKIAGVFISTAKFICVIKLCL